MEGAVRCTLKNSLWDLMALSTALLHFNLGNNMNHPIAIGTAVVALYEHCKTCGPSVRRTTKVSTRVLDSVKLDDGTYLYTMLDGRKIPQTDIVELV